MERVLYILSACALLGACVILGVCGMQWGQTNPLLDSVRSRSSVVQLFREGMHGHRLNAKEATPALVVQAEKFASYLKPPTPPAEKATPNTELSLSSPIAREVRPTAPSLKFSLRGTSYYPDQPGRSMALVSEPGGSEAMGKWVKEGDRLGHFVVQEIRKGAVVFLCGEDLRELAVEKRRASQSLVRDVRSGSQQANAAASEDAIVAPVPAGPNTVADCDGRLNGSPLDRVRTR